MIVRVQIGNQGFLFEETVWEKVLEENQVKNVLVTCEDEDGNVLATLQMHDPNEAVEEV